MPGTSSRDSARTMKDDAMAHDGRPALDRVAHRDEGPRPGQTARQHRRHVAAAALVMALLVVSGLVLIHLPGREPQRPPALAPDAVRTSNAQSVAADLRLVNYYPADRAWEQQWTRYDQGVTEADFAQISKLGATSVRLIVFPRVLGYPRPDPVEQQKLASAISLADAAGLRVWLTLFDNFTAYTELENSRTWTTAILSPYANDPRLSTVEIRNEIKPSSTSIPWAQDQIALIHRLLPTMPVAVSLNGAVDPSAYGTLVDSLSPEVPDLISYHYYGDAGLAYDHIQRVIRAVGTLPVVIGEAGMSTVAQDNRCPDPTCREAEQVDWFQIVIAAARQSGLAPPAPWTTYDLTSTATTRPLVATAFGYGLLRTDRTAKPSASVVAGSFANQWSTAPQNSDFTDTTMQGSRARAWVPWRISGSFTVEGGAGVDGVPGLVVRNTEVLDQGVSSWYTRPLTAVRPGQTWRVRVFVRGVAVTGTSGIGVVWLDGEGEYLGQDNSAKVVAGTSGWQELTVRATPRPGAGAVRIHLRSAGNSGTVVFSNPDWVVTTA